MPGDIILVAGKGHETYQDIQGIKSDFDDKKVISDAFAG
jgi:UDP-N-acetylmuramoyl-L-alanyl-D-glutamate--2,6-diaminopimelate ligase